MKVTEKDLENVAVLSRLAVPQAEKEEYLQKLNNFLEYVDTLSSLNTEEVQPTAHVLPLNNVFREDVIKPSLDRDLALSNAPLQEEGYFKVPKILED
ncbi:MAG: Asp-tRNA(Asn)/Glu-tRNA(Gln) amidotransferase subunit GatC [Lachnospiraceae bacterium]|nr:Asp-tRNA(Asn)/Glu-tRNA(Gln) amidotransferase subunit GatC [Lachnospiraceae bacterium]